MDQSPSVEAMEGRMSTALQNLAQVADELRQCSYVPEANKIGQLSHELVKTFGAVSVQLKDPSKGSQCLQQQQHFSEMLSYASSHSGFGPGLLHTQHAQQNLVIAEQTGPVDDIAHQAMFQPPVNENTWARVASSGSKVQTIERASYRANRNIKQIAGPSVPIRTPNRFNAVTKDAVEMYTAGPSGHLDENTNPSGVLLEDGMAGVVVIEGPLRVIPNFLSFLSTRIHEGAVYDMCIVNDRKAIAVFQYALHAQIFVDRNTESMATRGESVFGHGDWSVYLGQPMEWTDTLKRMCHPQRERRRLTFVKSRLFADHSSYLKWVREVEDVAGFGNVDFVWAFNTGNATAVFFSVATARKAMQTFINWRTNRGCYEDLSVSYSSDPCEKELKLTTQLRYHVQPVHRTFEQLGPSADNGERHIMRRS